MPADGVHLICIAKEPLPGRVKTRLSPAISAGVASALAAAALEDTLDVLTASPAVARTLAFDGDPTHWRRSGFTVVAQRGRGLDERLAAAFDDAWSLEPAPLLLLGMDTPQVTIALIATACRELLAEGTDAVLGPAIDGGWWALGLRRPDASLLTGVAMSTPHTGADQRRRLVDAGLRVSELPVLRDVDTAGDVAAVAAEAPGTRFASLVSSRLAS
jgi:rSAM/selenodomain-associated transferase 1